MKHFLPLLAAASLLVAMTACQPVEQTIAVTGVSIAPATLSLTVGETAQLTATVEPKDATDKTVVWSTSNNTVASVADGKVTAIAEGSATITAEAGGKKGTCSITVAPYVIPVTRISLDKESLELIEGETYTLTATLEPEDATDQTVVWQSSDEGIATVEDGVVTAVGIGTATLTATAPSEGLSASCEVTVSRNMDRNIVFADKNLEAMLVAAFDTDGDGGLSYQEAAEVTSLKGVFGNRKDFKSFDEFQYFTGVTTIEEMLFHCWEELVSIVLPESITAIEDHHAFFCCRSLTTIHIPSNVTSIIGNPFVGCSNLTCFTGKYASDNGRILVIDNCLISFAPAGLTTYSIPDNIIEIGRSSFAHCNLLSSITIPSSVHIIYRYAFEGCSGLVTVHIPESVFLLYDSCFAFCDKLKQFTGKFATSDGRALVVGNEMRAFAPYGLSHYTVPDGILVLDAYLFSWYSQIKSIKLPDGLKTLERQVFEGCSGLESINIPNSLISIGEDAFNRCTSLPNITIPANVKYIGARAFQDCNLSYIEMKATTPPRGSETMFVYELFDEQAFPIYVPKQSEKAYKQAEFWSEYADWINPPFGPVVDLGLSVNWATYNIGASSITDSGNYYAWGELDTKWIYDGANYLLGHMNDGILNMDYYNTKDGWTELQLYDDIASRAWGERFRFHMPTKYEYNELFDNCEWEWVTINNVKGIRLTSRINGNSIYFPAAGLIEGTKDYYRGTAVYCWASTKSSVDDYQAHSLASMNNNLFVMENRRVLGMPVRSVREKVWW